MFRFFAVRTQRMEEEVGEGGSPDAKRRRGFTRRETVEKLKELEGNVTAAVGENIVNIKCFVMFWAFPRCLGALWIFSPSRAIFGGKWSIQSPIDALKWVQSGPKCLKLVYFTPVNCFGLIRNISVHHLRCLEISSSRTLLFGDPEAVTLTT